ncbi:hypothetical protein, variant 2 [Aphanomyces invadans]|uniref:Transmembrane protein n=1 Tax=Aphanomyces invadans TaxID=157072 RepID=A0A024TDQ0_9STRA|nr:hypothetical protein, variant 2 [Aphanomyces invadans]ETV92183.1 hypothetical protein, variant 2 [Aphanomyces invadans]|eukprot:XP_008879150.1 hypothetical protein, variant 2 [Aphanomyces invadans]
MRSEEEELLEPLVDPSPPSPQMGKDRSGNPLAHGVHLSPWERYWHHGRIPWKVILHALLMFCGTLQIMLYDNQNSAYVRASYRNWAYFFLPNGGMSTSTRSMDATPLEESIFTVNDTLNAVAHVRDAYFSIKDVSVATYEYHYAAPTIVQPMLMSVTQYKNKTIGPPQHYNITPTSLGPFDDLDTTETAMVFLHSLVTIEFSFPLRDIDYGPFYVDCFDWTVRLTLAMHENSHFRLRVDECSLDVCSVKNVWATLRGRFVWMNVLVAVFAGIYLVVILRSVVRAVKRLARRPKHDPVPATLRDLNGHYCLIGATLVLVEFNALWNISSVVVHVPLRFDHRFIQALGPLLLWSTFVGWSDSSYVHAAFPVVASRLLPGGGVARLFWVRFVWVDRVWVPRGRLWRDSASVRHAVRDSQWRRHPGHICIAARRLSVRGRRVSVLVHCALHLRRVEHLYCDCRRSVLCHPQPLESSRHPRAEHFSKPIASHRKGP